MQVPRSKEARLHDWLMKQGKNIEEWEIDIKVKENEMANLKIDLEMYESLIELINDIDDKGQKELVEKVYQKEIIEERDEKVEEIRELQNEIKAKRDKIKAIKILIETSGPTS